MWLLLGAGLVVGLAVGVAASITGASICGAGEEGLRCYELSRTLAIRVGVVAGLMAVLMVLVVAGLLKMLSQDDSDRAEEAMEAYLASRSGGSSD
ncbi:MAG: hypothetical protein ACRDH8_04250 [Actinomycetota bacterium]